MLEFPVSSETAARLLLACVRARRRALGDVEGRTAAAKETPVHAAADKNVKSITTAVQYAFAKGRKALGKNADAKAAGAAVKKTLEDVLPSVLLQTLNDGGVAGTAMLNKDLRAAEFRAAKGPAATDIKMKFDTSNDRAAKWARDHAGELAKGISQTTEDAIKAAVARAQEEGDLHQLYDDILDAVGDDDRAALIGRTESMTAANEGLRESWSQAVDNGLLTGDEKRVWIATSDACDDCAELDGEETDLDGEYPNDGGDGPPLHPNCLPGYCYVLPSSRVFAASKRLFDGDLIVIRVSKDRELTCTPNHPILTPRGWVAASLLNVGDDVICDGRLEWRNIIGWDNQQMPATIENITDPFFQPLQGGTVRPVPTTTKDFHGDGNDSQIAIIGTNRSLTFRFNTTFKQLLLHPYFISGHVISRLTTFCKKLQLLLTKWNTSYCVMSRFRLAGTSFIIHRFPFQEFLFRLSSHFNSVFNQSTSNEISTRIKLTSQLINGRSCKVFTDQIVFINRFAWRGHVFNLQTEDGWYAAGGIITHNCRCTEGISSLSQEE